MFPNPLRLGQVRGIEIRVDPSWLVIAFIVAFFFYALFSQEFANLGPAARGILAGLSVIVFFGSVLLHELSHSLMAQRLEIPVESITLFLFGGFSKMKMEARQPRDEFLVAVVGPLTSLVLAAILWAIGMAGTEVLAPPLRFAVMQLAFLNLLLGLFNLLPGFPLDGGRVFRSVVWRASGSLTRATRAAVTGGRMIAALMIALGILSLFAGYLGGLWMAAIGWFLLQAASAAGQDVTIRHLLREVRAREMMSPELVTVPSGASLQEAVDDFFLRYDHSAFPVEDLDRPGLLTLRAVRQVPREQWDRRQVWTVITDLDELCTVGPETPMSEVMDHLQEQDQDRVLVMENGRVVGIITPRDVARWVRRSEELGLTTPDD